MAALAGCVIAFYGAACYFIFDYKRSEELPSSKLLSQFRPRGGRHTAKMIALVATGMTATLAVLIYAMPYVQKAFKGFGTAMTFAAFLFVFRMFQRNMPTTRVSVLAFRLATLAAAAGATYTCTANRNWATNNLCSVVIALSVLAYFRKMTARQCMALTMGIMAYDAAAVFLSGHMLKLVEGVGGSTGSLIAIPSGLASGSATAFFIGLGDVVFPGFIVVVAYRLGKLKGATGAILGYVAGLAVAIAVLSIFRFPQPATIYLVPATLLGFIACVPRRSEEPDIMRA